MAQADISSGSVLVIMCSDERSNPLRRERAPMIRLPGGVLSPLCPCASGATTGMREAILIEQIRLLVAAKQPSSIEVVTHAHCAAQVVIGLSDDGVKAYVRQFIDRLHGAGVRLPVLVVHDDHCKTGATRRHLFRMRCEPVYSTNAA